MAAVGVYLTKGTFDIFDSMEKLGIKKLNKIINDLNAIYSNAPNYVEIVTLGKEKVNVNTLKTILGNKYTEKDLEDFVKVFKNIENKGRDMSTSKRLSQMESLPMKYSDDFWIMLDKIDNEIAWSIIELDDNTDIKNKMGISMIDVSDDDYYLDVFYHNGRKGQVKVGEFIRTYLGSKYNKGQIYDFVRDYNKIKNRAKINPENVVEVPPFKYDPKNVRSTFISLVTETYPHGHEEEVMKFMPDDLTKDKYGNYYKIIGNSDTMFTSHLDTASRDKSDVIIVSNMKDGQELLMTDGTTILGADDKSGVAIMLYMMAHNVPGVYYFFIGEERGGIGSGKVADDFSSFPFLKDIKKVVSFDRRNYYSVITEQMGVTCCSDEFGESLCKELNKSGLKLNLDPTGVFTDSANFIDYIPECTNISVGYFNEHTHDEVQNITYLERLAKACVAVDWSNLVVKRKIGIDQELLDKWSLLIKDIKDMVYYNEVLVKGVEGKIEITIEFDDSSLSNAYEDLSSIESFLLIHRCSPDVKFDGNILKIQIY
jgi:hypothetical protein